MKQAGRPAKVRAAMLESNDVAAVIFHSRGFLVCFNAKTHSKFRYDTMKSWVSDVNKRMTDSIAHRELALKFDKIIGSVRSSFYNLMLAAKASTRVQINKPKYDWGFLPSFRSGFFRISLSLASMPDKTYPTIHHLEALI